MKRNYDKHTTADQAKQNILKFLNGLDGRDFHPNKSSLGYAAFPDYTFGWPQGAAFAVAKICRELEDDKLIQFHFGGHGESCGFSITQAGRNKIA